MYYTGRVVGGGRYPCGAFEAKNGPSGHHLINLVRHSDPMLEVVLALSARAGLIDRLHIETICVQLRAMLARLDGDRDVAGESHG